MKAVIHWFRRDLRVSDNSALRAAAATGVPVVPVYILSDWRGGHGWTGPNRQQFLCGSLAALAGNVKAIGGVLILRRGNAVEELERLVVETGAGAIFFNRDPDPFGRGVEARVEMMAARHGIECRAFKDICLHERDEVLTGTGEPFRVFTPYARAWHKLPKPRSGPALRSLRSPGGLRSEPLPELGVWSLGGAAGGILPAGERAARERMKEFVARRLGGYGGGRDYPGGTAVSRLSQDLRFGLISIRELYEASCAAAEGLDAAGRDSAGKFVSELIWREFYMQILWNFPEVLELEFNPRFRGMAWPGRRENFQRWCDGETGFPIVDAAMRELAETGFMHNRARMIVAMFLTKDLHLDWRLGEAFFMHRLVDGEIASNNGGWQWSAGTGADAAPYFRIQNPWTQTRRYDPEGRYIKRWLPELRDVASERFFEVPAHGERLVPGYPLPMVDHSAARDVALEFYGRHGKSG
jgi:deoxyribodipyrimidine photo-lyase